MTWDVPLALSSAPSLFVQLEFRVNDISGSSSLILQDTGIQSISPSYPPQSKHPKEVTWNSFPQVYKWVLSTARCCPEHRRVLVDSL